MRSKPLMTVLILLSGSANPGSLTMSGAKSVTANFSAVVPERYVHLPLNLRGPR